MLVSSVSIDLRDTRTFQHLFWGLGWAQHPQKFGIFEVDTWNRLHWRRWLQFSNLRALGGYKKAINRPTQEPTSWIRIVNPFWAKRAWQAHEAIIGHHVGWRTFRDSSQDTDEERQRLVFVGRVGNQNPSRGAGGRSLCESNYWAKGHKDTGLIVYVHRCEKIYWCVLQRIVKRCNYMWLFQHMYW